MESISLPATLPEPLQQVHLTHFSNLDPELQSAAIIRRIISASQLPTSTAKGASAQEVADADAERAKLDFAFLDPTRLCSKQHVLSAVTQAAVVCARSWDEEKQAFREGQGSIGGMKSKTPHSEIIYMLNPGNNVSADRLRVTELDRGLTDSISLASLLHGNRWESHSRDLACPPNRHRYFWSSFRPLQRIRRPSLRAWSMSFLHQTSHRQRQVQDRNRHQYQHRLLR